MASRRAKVNKFENKKISVNDVICPICRTILIKPITLPCSHGFCSTCFETNENANVCPLCRVRVGSWLRSATKAKKLINEALWETIQTNFPIEVNKKLKEHNGNNGVTEGKTNDTINSNLKPSDVQNSNKLSSTIKMQDKQNKPLTSVSTTLVKNSSIKSQNQNEKRTNFISNYATKEYTCRILCQNISSKDTQKTILKESQIVTQKKNKRIQDIKESELTNDRSNSIESECLYFKPIDYRHNPPSEGLAPIKVPTRKPNVSPHIKILAPSGQNQINVNHLESAFARLCSTEEKIQGSKKENIQSQVEDSNSVTTLKRKLEKSDRKTRKKVKTTHKPLDESESKGTVEANLKSICDAAKCKNSVKQDTNFTIGDTNKLTLERSTDEEKLKKSLQEQADFELAIKLQQSYNQSSQYSTRSVALKRRAAKNQVKVEKIMTPYKVK